MRIRTYYLIITHFSTDFNISVLLYWKIHKYNISGEEVRLSELWRKAKNVTHWAENDTTSPCR